MKASRPDDPDLLVGDSQRQGERPGAEVVRREPAEALLPDLADLDPLRDPHGNESSPMFTTP